MIGLEEKINAFYPLDKRRFLKKSLYYSPLVGSIEGQLWILGLCLYFNDAIIICKFQNKDGCLC